MDDPGKALAAATPSKPGRVRRVLAGLVVLVLVAGGALYWAHPAALPFLAPRAAPAGALVLQGNVDIREVNLAFRVGGRLARLAVDEGDAIAAGEVLAVLDPEPLQTALDAATARRAQAAADLAKYLAGARSEDIAMARAAVTEREATVQNARITAERNANLARNGAAPRQAADDSDAALREAEARLASGRQALAQQLAGFRAEDIAAATARDAEAAALLADAQRQLRDATLLAPSAGIIRARVQEPGAIVAAGATIFTMALTDPVWVRCYVSGIDLGRVRPGLGATIRTDDGQTWRGRVGYVSPSAEFTPKPVETTELRTSLVYRLRIIIDQPGAALRQGMPATVTLDAP